MEPELAAIPESPKSHGSGEMVSAGRQMYKYMFSV